MAEAFVEDIYQYSKLITELKNSVLRVRQRNRILYGQFFSEAYQHMCDLCKKLLASGDPFSKEFAEMVVHISDISEDKLVLCDYIEAEVLPRLREWINGYANIDVDSELGYQILSSKTGYLTAKILATDTYIHSAFDPMEEAREYLESVYDPALREYICWGCGMGYLIYQLYSISDGSVPITVYEPDENLVMLARNYGVLDWIPEENLTVITGGCGEEFVKLAARPGTGACFHPAELAAMPEGEEKRKLADIFIMANTAYSINQVLRINLYRNWELGIPDATVLRGKLKENAIIVAGGPSLEDSIPMLRHCQGKCSIIAVNTALIKLRDNSIRADYVTALDPYPIMVKQLEDVREETVPLIMNQTLYWRWGREYRGPKYMAYSVNSNCEEAKRYMKENQKEIWPSGGTVTFLAMEFAIRCGAKRIFLTGADFGFPGGKSHAEGSGEEVIQKQDFELIEVPDVGGGKVHTDYVMSIYRSAIEKRIEQMGNRMEFVNLSTNGARIHGTKEMSPKEAEQFLLDQEEG